jgi:hypothetical protein
MRSVGRKHDPTAWIAGSTTAKLRIDARHPFFFDHPLDHVPGMLLVAGLLDLIRDEIPAGSRLALSLEFPSMCELDRPTQLTATLENAGFRLTATQDGRAVCTGTVGVRAYTAPALVAGHRDWKPVSAELVHRARPENIALGEPEDVGGEVRVPVLPPTGYLAERGNGGYDVEAMIEAGRQLATLFAHTVAGNPIDSQLLWCRLDADLPITLPAGSALVLRTWPEQAKGRMLGYPAALASDTDGTLLGAVKVTCMALTPASYQRFRAAGRSA